MPDREALARLACSFLKHEFFGAVQQRKGKARPSFFLSDAFHRLLTSVPGDDDASLFERSSGSNHRNVVAAGDIFGLLDGLYEERARHLVDGFPVKVFLPDTGFPTVDSALDLGAGTAFDRVFDDFKKLSRDGHVDAMVHRHSQTGGELQTVRFEKPPAA